MKNDLSKVIMRFTYILIFFITLLACFTLFFSYINVIEKEKNQNLQNIQQITHYMETYNRILSGIVTEIYQNYDFQENLNDYYLSSPAEYMEDILSKDRSPTYLVDNLKKLVQDDEVKNISISLDYEKYLSAYAPTKNKKISFIRSLSFISEDMPDATLILDVSINALKKSLFPTHYNYSLSNGIDSVNLSEDISPSKWKKTQQIAIGNHTLQVYENPNYSSQTLLGLAIMIFLLMSLFILAIHQLLNRSFRNYIQQYQEIITSLNHSSTGDYKSINIENKVGDLKEIAMHINQFYLDNATYQKTLYENNWLKQEAKYAALQYQIEPHFLFNNLEFIRMTAILNDDEEISDSIYLLSKLYRNNTYQPDIIDLKEELINIDLSLQLHQRRYRHNFDYQLIDHIDQLMLPKLSLQPFVENYIKHGFDSSKKENRLTVYATETTNHYVLKIVENGKGMDQDKLEHIQQKLNDDIPYSENIGISNSFRRIKHLYPGDTRFVIESQLHVGTTITIKIQKGGNMHVENCNC